MTFVVRTGLFAFSLSFLMTIGCSGSGPSRTETEIHLKELSLLYGKYVGRHRGQAPPNEEAFKAFIHTMKKTGQTKIDDVDDLFLSPRDNSQYVVRYGGRPGKVVAYEKTGSNGKRYVAFVTTEVKELDEAEFRKELGK